MDDNFTNLLRELRMYPGDKDYAATKDSIDRSITKQVQGTPVTEAQGVDFYQRSIQSLALDVHNKDDLHHLEVIGGAALKLGSLLQAGHVIPEGKDSLNSQAPALGELIKMYLKGDYSDANVKKITDALYANMDTARVLPSNWRTQAQLMQGGNIDNLAPETMMRIESSNYLSGLQGRGGFDFKQLMTHLLDQKEPAGSASAENFLSLLKIAKPQRTDHLQLKAFDSMKDQKIDPGAILLDRGIDITKGQIDPKILQGNPVDNVIIKIAEAYQKFEKNLLATESDPVKRDQARIRHMQEDYKALGAGGEAMVHSAYDPDVLDEIKRRREQIDEKQDRGMDKAADVLYGTPYKHFEEMVARLSELGTTLATGALGPLDVAVRGATEAFTALNAFLKEHKTTGEVIGAGLAGLVVWQITSTIIGLLAKSAPARALGTAGLAAAEFLSPELAVLAATSSAASAGLVAIGTAALAVVAFFSSIAFFGGKSAGTEIGRAGELGYQVNKMEESGAHAYDYKKDGKIYPALQVQEEIKKADDAAKAQNDAGKTQKDAAQTQLEAAKAQTKAAQDLVDKLNESKKPDSIPTMTIHPGGVPTDRSGTPGGPKTAPEPGERLGYLTPKGLPQLASNDPNFMPSIEPSQGEKNYTVSPLSGTGSIPPNKELMPANTGAVPSEPSSTDEKNYTVSPAVSGTGSIPPPKQSQNEADFDTMNAAKEAANSIALESSGPGSTIAHPLRGIIHGLHKSPGGMPPGTPGIPGTHDLNHDGSKMYSPRGPGSLPSENSHYHPRNSMISGHGSVPGSSSGGDLAGKPPADWQLSDAKKLMKMGMSAQDAAGTIANITAESAGNSNASGDSGKAFGLGQWHPNRQADFKRLYGKDIKDSTHEEQLRFYYDEMKLRHQIPDGKTAADSARSIMQHYEVPKDRDVGGKNDRTRRSIAEGIFKGLDGSSSDIALSRWGSGNDPEHHGGISPHLAGAGSAFASEPSIPLQGLPIDTEHHGGISTGATIESAQKKEAWHSVAEGMRQKREMIASQKKDSWHSIAQEIRGKYPGLVDPEHHGGISTGATIESSQKKEAWHNLANNLRATDLHDLEHHSGISTGATIESAQKKEAWHSVAEGMRQKREMIASQKREAWHSVAMYGKHQQLVDLEHHGGISPRVPSPNDIGDPNTPSYDRYGYTKSNNQPEINNSHEHHHYLDGEAISGSVVESIVRNTNTANRGVSGFDGRMTATQPGSTVSRG
jgi:hypothetical protein